jgi:hypothetical protein
MVNISNATDWRLVDERDAGGFLYIDRGPDYYFLRVEPEEHARLIAAAPAMLAALKMAAHDLGVASGDSTILEILKVGPLARAIDRAIAAAEGI